MGSTVRLESNSASIVEKALTFFSRYQGPPGEPEFLWRIVGELKSPINGPSADVTAFSDDCLRFANLAQHGLLAVDLRAREAVAFVDETSVEGEPRLHCRPPFDTLFCMCAASLGKTSFEAACVGKREKGILICGPPNSGKTTSAYLAAKRGLEFHADQAVFLEMQAGGLRAWGDLLPAVFRPEALQFYPELRSSTLFFSHSNFAVHYLSKKPFQNAAAHPLTPVGCVFLKRGGARKASLTAIAPGRRVPMFENALLYQEIDEFRPQTSAVIDALAKLQNYELTFQDPADAADRICKLLE